MSPSLDIYSINAVADLNSLYLSTILHNKKDEAIETKTLIDSGARGIFMDQNFAWKHNFRQMELKQPIKPWNIDGTKNKQGAICFYTDLDIKIGDQMFHKIFYITGLGSQKVILGLPWLRTHNPEIDWKKDTVTWRNSDWSKNLVKEWQLKRESIKKGQQPTMEEEEDLESIKNYSLNPLLDMDTILLEFMNMEDEVWINTKTNVAA